MNDLPELFSNKSRWAERVESRQPGFFAGLAAQQSPRCLWIGCSDSRVPANDIVGLAPGELFVHRDVAHLHRESLSGLTDGAASLAAAEQLYTEATTCSALVPVGPGARGGVVA